MRERASEGGRDSGRERERELNKQEERECAVVRDCASEGDAHIHAVACITRTESPLSDAERLAASVRGAMAPQSRELFPAKRKVRSSSSQLGNHVKAEEGDSTICRSERLSMKLTPHQLWKLCLGRRSTSHNASLFKREVS